MSSASSTPHGLPCPSCKVPLVMSERQGVEIDYCPQCRGVWLDRGELDKIIERQAAEAPRAQPQPQASAPAYEPHGRAYEERRPHYKDDKYYRDDKYRHSYPKRRKSFLEELFD